METNYGEAHESTYKTEALYEMKSVKFRITFGVYMFVHKGNEPFNNIYHLKGNHFLLTLIVKKCSKF